MSIFDHLLLILQQCMKLFYYSHTILISSFKITDLGKTTKLSTATFQTTHITPTILRINLPTTNRRRRSPSGNLYGIGFHISLSYDNIHFGKSMPIVIFNDVCYTCSVSTLECNITVKIILTNFHNMYMYIIILPKRNMCWSLICSEINDFWKVKTGSL